MIIRIAVVVGIMIISSSSTTISSIGVFRPLHEMKVPSYAIA